MSRSADYVLLDCTAPVMFTAICGLLVNLADSRRLTLNCRTDNQVCLLEGYRDRVEAGQKLAKHLAEYSGRNPLILAIPRGGVVVGFELTRSLSGELDVVTPRKMGAPGNPELAMGAILHDGTKILNEDVISMMGVSDRFLHEEAERQTDESLRRYKLYRGDRSEPNLKGRAVIVVDDGVATGATMTLALKWTRGKGAKPLICAVPVAPPETLEKLKREADKIVCPLTPMYFMAIGQFYRDFEQLEDDEVIELLNKAWSGKFVR